MYFEQDIDVLSVLGIPINNICFTHGRYNSRTRYQICIHFFAGWLYDALEVYPPLFYLGGGCILLSASILVLPLCLERCGFRTEQKSTYRMNDPDAGDKFLG